MININIVIAVIANIFEYFSTVTNLTVLVYFFYIK